MSVTMNYYHTIKYKP